MKIKLKHTQSPYGLFCYSLKNRTGETIFALEAFDNAIEFGKAVYEEAFKYYDWLTSTKLAAKFSLELEKEARKIWQSDWEETFRGELETYPFKD
tara:strand:- start:829 stop:1113 length:285 start_codon:yes stop_codon:yes gene_type:complete